MIKELTPFYEAVNDPTAMAKTIKSNPAGQKKIIGYMCSYAPEELIHAAGCHPMRLFSSKSDITLADNHLQAYCCSLIRGVLEDRLSGRLDFLDGTVFPHTCDSIQRLSDIWRLNTAGQGFFADVIMPAKLTTNSARTYMTDVLTKFRTDLGTYMGSTITDKTLTASIALFNRIRKNLARIYELKSLSPAIITGKDLFTVIKGSMLMDRDLLDCQLQDLVTHLESVQPPPFTGKRLILTGSVCDMPDLYTLLEDAGAAVVGDDLCSGQRWFEGLIPEDLSPMEGLTSRYTDRVVCPAKHSGNTVRGEELVSLAKSRQAHGVIFTLLKFCDPHAFDYPYLKEFLDNAGIKSLHLEMDDQQQGGGQMATRLETFIHMI